MSFMVLVERLHEICSTNWSEDTGQNEQIEEESEEVIKQIFASIESVDCFLELERVIERENNEHIMPMDVMFSIYRRAIDVAEDQVTLLQQMADYLLLFGPDWEEEARSIIAHLANDRVAEAINVAQKVDYYKYG